MKAERLKTWIWVLIGLNFLDLLSTSIGLRYFNLIEANPLGFGIYVFIMKSLFIPSYLYLIAKYFHKIPQPAKHHYYKGVKIGLLFNISIYLMVVINNFSLIAHKLFGGI